MSQTLTKWIHRRIEHGQTRREWTTSERTPLQGLQPRRHEIVWWKAGIRLGGSWKLVHNIIKQQRQRSRAKILLVALLFVLLWTTCRRFIIESSNSAKEAGRKFSSSPSSSSCCGRPVDDSRSSSDESSSVSTRLLWGEGHPLGEMRDWTNPRYAGQMRSRMVVA